MITISTLYQIMRADFLERIRRSSFFITLLAIIAVTYFFIPAMDAPFYAYINIGGYRPIYNSAWIGLNVTFLMAEFFPWFGFFLVKNAIERDRRTGVGEIIASTPISRQAYILGKWLSNLAVYLAITIITILSSLILQFIRAEDFRVDMWALVSPFLFVLLPLMVVMAALAVFFESVRWLRGGFGNLVYYIVFGLLVFLGDVQGVNATWKSVYQACGVRFTGCSIDRQIDLEGGDILRNLATFEFSGVIWTAEMVLARLAWVGIALGFVALAGMFFHRFDPAKAGEGFGTSIFTKIKKTVPGFLSVHVGKNNSNEEILDASLGKSQPAHNLNPLPDTKVSPVRVWAQLLVAELRLTFKSVHWFWYLGALGIIVATFATPPDIGCIFVLPLAWVWPVLIWSLLGVREVQYHAEAMVLSTPYPLGRHLPVIWLVGELVTFALGMGVFVRIALAGDWGGLVAMVIGAIFIPSLALALNCWSNSSKLFQAVYLFLWYLGSVQGVFFLDFLGHYPGIFSTGLPWVYATLAIFLIFAAVAGRRRQMMHC
jgi:hypothetical protein